MEFWSKVPYEWKLNKKLYRRYLEKVNPAYVFGEETQRNMGHTSSSLKKILSSSTLWTSLQGFKNRLKSYTEYWEHNSQQGGLVSFPYFASQRHHFRNANAFKTKRYLHDFLQSYDVYGLEEYDRLFVTK